MTINEGVSISNVLRNIGYYYAFCECIECRLAALLSDRDYQAFYTYVYKYAMCGFSESLATEANNLERGMWGFTVNIHDKYAQALVDRGLATHQISFATNVQKIQGANERITTKQRYEILSQYDHQNCIFASRLQHDKGNLLKFKQSIVNEIRSMLVHLNRSFNLYLNVTDNMVKYIEKSPEILEKFDLTLKRRDYILDALFNQKKAS